MREDDQACDFLMWYDPEWPAPMQRSLTTLWSAKKDGEELLAENIFLKKQTNALYADKLKAEDSKMEMELMMADKLFDMEEKEKKSQQKILSKLKALKMELNKKDLFVWVLVGSNVALFAVLAVFVALKM